MEQELYHIIDEDICEKIKHEYGNKGGVYKIVAFRDNQFVPIHRFLQDDYAGVLYIDKAAVFHQRILNLQRCILPGYFNTGHAFSRRYDSNKKIAQIYPLEILHIVLMPGDDVSIQEENEIDAYKDIFGELPPLNGL